VSDVSKAAEEPRWPLFVVGGEQRGGFAIREEWHRYRTALVVRVEGGRVERVLEYRSPAAHCPDVKPSFVFKAATFAGDTAWLCTQTEVLECELPGFAIRRVISLPCFNDLHHVAPGPAGTLFVAVTGLDAVAEVSRDGELIRLVDVLGGDVWDRFSRDVDYRKIPTTKPHRAHPNYVFFLAGEPWVTRFQQRDAVPLEDLVSERRFQVGEQGIHDGSVEDGRLLFTSVDGHVVRFDLATGKRTHIGLAQPDDDHALGWCRGLLPCGGGRAWVGFSRFRYTKLRQNISWARHGFRTSQDHRRHPTRIVLYDLEGFEGLEGGPPGPPALLHRVDLEDAGMGAVFSIHAEAASRAGTISP
jgi:hypothetical protein